jgi:hypothetical protein
MPRGGQKSYIQEMKERPKQTKPGDPLQWKDLPKKAKGKTNSVNNNKA